MSPDDFNQGICEIKISFSDKLKYDYGNLYIGLILFILNYIAISLVFSFVIFKVSNWIKNFKKSGTNKKIFLIELCIFILFLGWSVSFSILGYDGVSCFANDCISISLFPYVVEWTLLSLLEFMFSSPVILFMFFPYLIAFLIRSIARRKIKTNVNQ